MATEVVHNECHFVLVDFFNRRLSTDTSIVGTAVTNNISDGLRASFQAAAGVSMMVFTSPKLAGVVCQFFLLC